MALTGSLALATFVKFFGTLFLGQERTNATAGAHDPSAAMLVPMGMLAGLCFAVGALPRLVLVPIGHVVRMWTGNSPSDVAALAAAIGGLGTASIAGTAAAGGALVLALWLRARARNAAESSVGTWDCGYATPSVRMQYNESSFGELVGRLFEGILIPQRQQPNLDARFPTSSAYRSETPDVVLDRGLLPLLAYAARLLMSLRLVQQGQVQVYVSYILFGLIVLLVVAR
jgi:NADH:ubiquinone oxidoreductase subunit 5 (subunit L)/multisubunit Na+/H+ antiporter MnhA subunit